MTDHPDKDQVLDYLRRRGNVQVPGDLRQRATTQVSGGRSSRRTATRGVLSVAVLAVVVVVVGLLVISAPAKGPMASSNPSNAAAVPATSQVSTGPASESPTTQASGLAGAPFPSTVLGMPVITVAEASSLAAAGDLNGRDVAVGGWFSEEFPPCPGPDGYVGPLEDPCRLVGFADTKSAATVCTVSGAGTSCSGMGSDSLAPWIMNDTTGIASDDWGATQATVPIVVIGHLGDPRQWQCLNISKCASDFVADRVAWANGAVLAPMIQPLYGPDRQIITPALSPTLLAQLLGDDKQLLSAAVVTADDVRDYDPRWNETGQRLMWVVRWAIKAPAIDLDPTRFVNVSLFDDATGQLISTNDLALTSGYNPARLWITTEIHHSTDANYGDSILPSYTVASDGGASVHSGPFESGEGSTPVLTTFGPDIPLLVDPGGYSLTSTLQPPETAQGEPPSIAPIECSTHETLNAGDDVMLTAIYDKNGTCTWSNEETPSFGFP